MVARPEIRHRAMDHARWRTARIRRGTATLDAVGFEETVKDAKRDMTATEPTATPATQVSPLASLPPADPAVAQARWRLLRNGVVGATLAAAVVLAAICFLVARP